jgi:hypothetical protein
MLLLSRFSFKSEIRREMKYQGSQQSMYAASNDGRYKNYPLKRSGKDWVLSVKEVLTRYLPGD